MPYVFSQICWGDFWSRDLLIKVYFPPNMTNISAYNVECAVLRDIRAFTDLFTAEVINTAIIMTVHFLPLNDKVN